MRSTKSLRSSVSGQGVSSRSEPEADEEDQKPSETNLAVRRGVREGGVVRRGGGGGGRPDELDASPRGLYEDFRVSILLYDNDLSNEAAREGIDSQLLLDFFFYPRIIQDGNRVLHKIRTA